jgi:hypothetical protein
MPGGAEIGRYTGKEKGTGGNYLLLIRRLSLPIKFILERKIKLIFPVIP